jgi:DNA-binding response OmpR family regulator
MTRRKSSGHDIPVPTPPAAASIVTAGAIRLLVDGCEAYVGERRVALSPTESRLLRVLIEHHQRVVTRTALMMTAWGTSRVESVAMLEEQINALRARLGEDATIETVTGIGYRLL